LIGLAIWLGSQVEIRVTAQLPANNLVGPFQALTFAFSEAVDESLTIEKFSIQPAVHGTYQWMDAKTLRFVPTEPFQLETVYTLNLAPGPLTQDGRLLKKSKSWKFQVRQPRVVYLTTDTKQSRLWTVETDSGKINPLTDASRKIYDFDASRDGEFVIFSAFNEQQGIDLWRVNRAGGSAVLLLQCGHDRCSVPAISPDGRRVAYVHEAADPGPDLQFGAPRIWILDIESKQDSPLYEDRQIVGYGPSWSPDGLHLSSFDGMADEIRLLNLRTSEQSIIPSQIGNPVTWSPDGSIFVFTDVTTNDLGLRTRIREAKLSIKETTTMFGDKDQRDYHYSSLAWSPVKDELVIGLSSEENNPAEALWLMSPARLDGQVIADQPDYIYNTPSWDPWGRALIFQQFKLHGVYKPEIGLWTPKLKEPRVLAEGILPHWLP
jgi:Tol biopolymer transport system component